MESKAKPVMKNYLVLKILIRLFNSRKTKLFYKAKMSFGQVLRHQ